MGAGNKEHLQGRNQQRKPRRRNSKQDVAKGLTNEQLEQKGKVSQKRGKMQEMQDHRPRQATEETVPSFGKFGRRPNRATDLKVDHHPYRHPVNSPALTPTAALALAMCNHALDSPAFNTRRRSSVAYLHDEHDVSTEVQKAVMWWVNGLSLKSGLQVKPEQKKRFKENLYRELEFRCVYHWYPKEPQRGSGYRSVLCDINVDVALARACAAAELSTDSLPRPRVMFVNPGEVKVMDTNTNVAEVVYHASHQAVDKQGETKRGNNAILQAFNSQIRKKQLAHQTEWEAVLGSGGAASREC